MKRKVLCAAVVLSAVLGASLAGPLWSLAAPDAAPAAQAGTPVAMPVIREGTVASKLGVNLEEVCDYARAAMFVDAMKSARAFGSADAPWDEKAELDANGWPKTDAGSCVITDLPNAAGTYHFSCKGRTTVEVIGNTATVANLQYDHKANRTTAEIRVPEKGRQLYLSFRNVGKDGIQEIKLIRPGYAPDTTQTFTNEFLTAIKPFSTLRLMDFARTNKGVVKTWDDRAKVTDPMQSTEKGAAWEYAIQLANETDKDLWVNIPDQADDAYVRAFARLLKEKLEPGRKVYVEYSNEVWNAMFPQFHRNLAAAEAEVKAGDTQLTDGGKDKNKWYWGWKRVSKKTVQISDIFRDVYGDAAMNKTVRVILPSQSAGQYMLRLQMEYMDKYHGAPKKYIYGIAGAPYFGMPPEFDKKEGVPVDDMFDKHLPGAINGWCKDVMFNFQLAATYYGVKNLCYEGGPGLEGEINTANKIAANRDERMGDMVDMYLRNWYETGGDLFMYFSLSGAYSKYGSWGMTEDISQQTPKTRAVAKLAAEKLPQAKPLGFAIPAEIPAASPHQREGGGFEKSADGGQNLAFIRDGNMFDYVIHAREAGTYTIKLKTGSGQDGAKVRLLVNSQDIGTITPPNNGAWGRWVETPGVDVELAAGNHVLRVETVKSGFNFKAIVVEKKAAAAAAD